MTRTPAEIHADCWTEQGRLIEIIERYAEMLKKVHHSRAIEDGPFEAYYGYDKEQAFDDIAAEFECEACEKWVREYNG